VAQQLGLPGLLLGALWGISYTLFLWLSARGRFLRKRRTWLAVTLGVGVDLLLGLTVVEPLAWLWLAGIIAASALPVIGACLLGEYDEHQHALNEARRGE
jgi:hypothetical protein